MAHALRQRRRSQFDEITNVPIYYPPIGQKWINRFLIRHPELKSTIGRTIDAARVTDPTRSTLSVWYDTLREVVKDYDIAPENMYNMDDAIIRPYIQRWLEVSVNIALLMVEITLTVNTSGSTIRNSTLPTWSHWV